MTLSKEQLEAALEALLDYKQADADGIMVLTSREAIHVLEPIIRAALQRNDVPQTVSTDVVLSKLKEKCNQYGGQNIYAEEYGYSPSYISDVLNKRRNMTDAHAKKLGFARVDAWMSLPAAPKPTGE